MINFSHITHDVSVSPAIISSTALPSSNPTISPASDSSSCSAWHQIFIVPWEKMLTSLRAAVSNERHPVPADHCQMVWIIVDEMQQCTGRTMQNNYLLYYSTAPRKFCRLLDNGKMLLASDYETLLTQLYARI